MVKTILLLTNRLVNTLINEEVIWEALSFTQLQVTTHCVKKKS